MRVLFNFFLVLIVALSLLCGCDEAVQTTEQGGSNAVGIAENMSGGTVAGTDLETGDVAEETGEEVVGEGGE